MMGARMSPEAQRTLFEAAYRSGIDLETVLRPESYANLRTPRPAYASDPSIIEGEFKVVADGR